jgi:hypothetical protein
MERKVRTLQLEQHALAGRDLGASLAHPLECQWDLLLVAARHAVCENVHVIAVLEKVQGGLQHADMRLHSDISCDTRFALRSQGDVPRCP